MTRRVTAVSLACLLAVGFTPPLHLQASSVEAAPLHALPAARCGAVHAFKVPAPRSPKPGDVAKVMTELGRRLAGITPPAQITVPVYVHVITRGARRVTGQDVKAQIDALNTAYAGGYGGVDTGVRFRLDGVTVTENDSWFADPVADERPMKVALHQGDARTLNLYIAQLSEQMLGFASYPYWYDESPRLDGVVIDWRSLPGGAMSNYNRGFTGVHEIGHWLGLFHTFENGCDLPGDGIADTPMEARPTEGCPADKDSCTSPGGDPMHNFMDYAHDTCMSEFTQGQADRMRQMWAVYRNTPQV